MELTPEIIESVADMLGTKLNTTCAQENEVEDDDNSVRDSPRGKTKRNAATKFLIRPGSERDVLEATSTRQLAADRVEQRPNGGCDGEEYTYADYEREFLMERSEEEVYADDGRKVAEYEILEAGPWSLTTCINFELRLFGCLSWLSEGVIDITRSNFRVTLLLKILVDLNNKQRLARFIIEDSYTAPKVFFKHEQFPVIA
jgi:hypothetical protein